MRDGCKPLPGRIRNQPKALKPDGHRLPLNQDLDNARHTKVYSADQQPDENQADKPKARQRTYKAMSQRKRKETLYSIDNILIKDNVSIKDNDRFQRQK